MTSIVSYHQRPRDLLTQQFDESGTSMRREQAEDLRHDSVKCGAMGMQPRLTTPLHGLATAMRKKNADHLCMMRYALIKIYLMHNTYLQIAIYDTH